MMFQMLFMLFLALLLSLGIELFAWQGLQKITRKFNYTYLFLAIIAVNFATNPAVNVLSSVVDPARTLWLFEVMLELSVILIEAGIFYLIYRQDFKKFLLLSSVMNLCSYAVGLLLFTPAWL